MKLPRLFNNRMPWLVGALAVAAVLVVTDERDGDGVVQATRGAGPPGASVVTVPAPSPLRQETAGQGAPGTRAAAVQSMILELRPRRDGGETPNMFEPRNWNPPPPPSALAAGAVPPRPPPPPFTFTILGKQFVDNRWEVFLGQGARTLIVKQGDAIDGVFTVERIAPPTMTLAVRQYDDRQSVQIGPAD